VEHGDQEAAVRRHLGPGPAQLELEPGRVALDLDVGTVAARFPLGGRLHLDVDDGDRRDAHAARACRPWLAPVQVVERGDRLEPDAVAACHGLPVAGDHLLGRRAFPVPCDGAEAEPVFLEAPVVEIHEALGPLGVLHGARADAERLVGRVGHAEVARQPADRRDVLRSALAIEGDVPIERQVGEIVRLRGGRLHPGEDATGTVARTAASGCGAFASGPWSGSRAPSPTVGCSRCGASPFGRTAR
jgi:hypothetical protein